MAPDTASKSAPQTSSPLEVDLPTDPQLVVVAFLDALQRKDIATASALIDDDIYYANRGLPSVRGREEMGRVFDLSTKSWSGFEYCNHAISSEGAVVLTERTDVLIAGPLRLQFWVWGRFEVTDGRITLWRDSFDVGDMVRATARGIAGILVPSLRPTSPLDPAAIPGR